MLPDKKWPFIRSAIEYAPEDRGVFILWHNDEPIYVGRVSDGSIKAELLAHQDGARGECTMRATHYSWEITIWPSARETELLAIITHRYGRDPRCQNKAA